uniref:Protein cramped-like protein n=2 Tax=Lygus hesperus TaxID=30085 RepID=A0A0A9WQS3_LYGHE
MESLESSNPKKEATEILPPPPEKVTASGIQLRTSARVSKKLKEEQEAALAALNFKKAEEAKEEQPPVVEEKPRMRRIPWSPDDKAAFFEALNEHGKNFDEIEKYMAARAKRRTQVIVSNNKNRERARHFYYRAWHKLSKHVKIPDCIKKTTQELYALINFGELRKKVGHVTERNAQKLNELIYSGCTQVRVRGKAWRIKTPVCRALRKLNVFEDDGEDLKLPSKINILITARSNRDAARVQSIAHNTKIKTTLSIDSSVQNITTFLSRRWSAAHGTDVLRVGPRKDAVPTHANFKCGPVMTSSSVSLIAHEKKNGSEGYEKVRELLRQLQIGKTKATLKYQSTNAVTGDDSEINSEVVDPKSLAPPPQSGSDAPLSQESGDMRNRIGQLYLMYGKQGLLELEYWWEETDKENVGDLSKTLSRLLSAAKLFHTKTKVECPCGHVCKGSMKVSGNSQSKANKQQKSAAKKVDGANKDAGTFKQPYPATSIGRPIQPSEPSTTPASEAAVAALKILQNSRYCQRPGRRRQSRSVVVQRMLPVLPKSPFPVISTIMSINGVQVVSNYQKPQFPGVGNVMCTPSTSSSPAKSLPVILPKTEPSDTLPPNLPVSSSAMLTPKLEPSLELPGVSTQSPVLPMQVSSSVDAEPHDLLESFKKELANSPNLDGHTTTLDGIISSLPGAEKPDPTAGALNSFKGILSSSQCSSEPGGGMLEVTPPTSPTRILKEGESQWLNADVNDFSLSSFLGHLESPLKSNGVPGPLEDTHMSTMSTDMESHFQSLMAESSLDYTAKFADLAAKIVGPSPSTIAP